MLLGEAKWSGRPFDRRALEQALRELAARPVPSLPSRLADAEIIRVLFVPEISHKSGDGLKDPETLVLTARDLLDGES